MRLFFLKSFFSQTTQISIDDDDDNYNSTAPAEGLETTRSHVLSPRELQRLLSPVLSSSINCSLRLIVGQQKACYSVTLTCYHYQTIKLLSFSTFSRHRKKSIYLDWCVFHPVSPVSAVLLHRVHKHVCVCAGGICIYAPCIPPHRTFKRRSSRRKLLCVVVVIILRGRAALFTLRAASPDAPE